MIRKRCAIYTRKSTEEGLEQEFNSLDAQGESCAAYILSQAGEGWENADRIYSDGGISGGHMKRPGLKALLADVEAGLIDVIIVYKVDRLTRSLADFAKLVEVFDANDVSFVSVTQAFNTTNSMGRLTLNVLLSFAQFEREVTAERIRDKIAASKKKGKWMGGLVPLGYYIDNKKLVINEDESETVRLIFTSYLAKGSVSKVKAELDRTGLKTKVRFRQKHGQPRKKIGGLPFHRGHIYQLLSNPIYIGKVRHKEQVLDGEHEAIVTQDMWDRVQASLSSNAPIRTQQKNTKTVSLLKGILFDQTGDRLGPSHHKKAGRSYAYYISRRLIKGELGDGTGWRLPAKTIEGHVVRILSELLKDQSRVLAILDKVREAPEDTSPDEVNIISQKSEQLLKLISDKRPAKKRAALTTLTDRIEMHTDKICIHIKVDAFAPNQRGEPIVTECLLTLKKRGIETRLIIGGRASHEPDAKILGAIAKSRKWYAGLKSGNYKSISDIACREKMHRTDVGKLLPLAFLSPKLIGRFMSGDHPADMTLDTLKRKLSKLPSDWNAQTAYLGLSASTCVLTRKPRPA